MYLHAIYFPELSFEINRDEVFHLRRRRSWKIYDDVNNRDNYLWFFFAWSQNEGTGACQQGSDDEDNGHF